VTTSPAWSYEKKRAFYKIATKRPTPTILDNSSNAAWPSGKLRLLAKAYKFA